MVWNWGMPLIAKGTQMRQFTAARKDEYVSLTSYQYHFEVDNTGHRSAVLEIIKTLQYSRPPICRGPGLKRRRRTPSLRGGFVNTYGCFCKLGVC